MFVDHLKMKKIPTNKNSSSAVHHPSHLGICSIKRIEFYCSLICNVTSSRVLLIIKNLEDEIRNLN